MDGVGPWLGVGAVEGEKYPPPRAGKRARAGNFARGLCFWGPGGPVTNTSEKRLAEVVERQGSMIVEGRALVSRCDGTYNYWSEWRGMEIFRPIGR